MHCGISLQTNGGTLIKTDDANCCCIYFQSRYPSQLGHYETVRDKQGRLLWGADDQVLNDCLWAAMKKTKVARSVRDSRTKMLVAAHNRINISNETFQVGDCAWLIIPSEIVSQVTGRLKKREVFTAVESKMLVKIARIIVVPAVAGQSPLPTQHFVVWTEDGRVESTFSIDQLQRCHPPPESSVYRVVDVELPSQGEAAEGGRRKPVTLAKAYQRFLTLHSTRLFIAEQKAKQAVNQRATIATTMVNMAASSASTTPVRPLTPPPKSDGPPPKERTEIDLLHAPEGMSDPTTALYSL